MNNLFEKFIKFIKNEKAALKIIFIILLLNVIGFSLSSSRPIGFLCSAFILLWLTYFLTKSSNKKTLDSNVKIGFGYDVHKLESNTSLVLCATQISNTKGLSSHSDGDVATHALIDALLSAADLPDIGTIFPDNCPEFENISSLTLLQKTINLLEQNNFKPLQVNLTIVAQKPKLQPFYLVMKTNLNSALKLPISNISIKATTEENLGFTGNEEGIKAYCIAMIKSTNTN